MDLRKWFKGEPPPFLAKQKIMSNFFCQYPLFLKFCTRALNVFLVTRKNNINRKKKTEASNKDKSLNKTNKNYHLGKKVTQASFLSRSFIPAVVDKWIDNPRSNETLILAKKIAHWFPSYRA